MKEELFTRLDAIAAKLGVAAEHLWGVLIRQVVVGAVWQLVMLCVVFGVCFVLFRWWYRCLRVIAKKEGYATLWGLVEEKEEAVFAYYIVLAAVVIVCATMFCVVGHNIVLGFVNPEYRALQLLRELI